MVPLESHFPGEGIQTQTQTHRHTDSQTHRHTDTDTDTGSPRLTHHPLTHFQHIDGKDKVLLYAVNYLKDAAYDSLSMRGGWRLMAHALTDAPPSLVPSLRETQAKL